jgi:hypothetical protein
MIKNRDIVNPNTLKLLQEMTGSKLPAVAAFKLNHNTQKLQAVLDNFNKVHQETVKKYTKTVDDKPVHPVGEDGKPDETKVTLTDPEAFGKEIEALLDTDVTEAAGVMTIKIAELGNYEIEPARFSLVSWMFAL